MAIGANTKANKERQAKIFHLTPASQVTTKPLNKINSAVPRSGWVTTIEKGINIEITGTSKYLSLLTSPDDVR